jgi:hypothetical protein
MTQDLVGSHLNSLRSETSAAQSKAGNAADVLLLGAGRRLGPAWRRFMHADQK